MLPLLRTPADQLAQLACVQERLTEMTSRLHTPTLGLGIVVLVEAGLDVGVDGVCVLSGTLVGLELGVGGTGTPLGCVVGVSGVPLGRVLVVVGTTVVACVGLTVRVDGGTVCVVWSSIAVADGSSVGGVLCVLGVGGVPV